MGCDFWWTGTVPDQADQARVIEMNRAFYDYPGEWPVIVPEPGRRVNAYFGESPLLDPNTDLRAVIGVVENYPYNFFGTAPWLRAGEDSNIMRRGQLVFDRSDGGRCVSILPIALLCNETDVGLHGDNLYVNPGGYERLLPDDQCVMFALFLTLLRLRYCPDLDALDDRLHLEHVYKALATGGFLETAVQPDLDYPRFISDFADYYNPPGKGQSSLEYLSDDLGVVDHDKESFPFSDLADGERSEVKEDAQEVTTPLSNHDRLNMDVEELFLTVRTRNGLRKAGIRTLGQLTLLTDSDLQQARLGRKGIEEIKSLLAEYDLGLFPARE